MIETAAEVTHKDITPPLFQTPFQAPYQLPTASQTHVQHSPCSHRIGKAQTQSSHHSHRIYIAYQDNLTDKPRTTTRLQTSHKHTDLTVESPQNKQHCTTHDNAPKGYGPYLTPKTHIQHTHLQHLSTSTHATTTDKSTHRNRME